MGYLPVSATDVLFESPAAPLINSANTQNQKLIELKGKQQAESSPRTITSVILEVLLVIGCCLIVLSLLAIRPALQFTLETGHPAAIAVLAVSGTILLVAVIILFCFLAAVPFAAKKTYKYVKTVDDYASWHSHQQTPTLGTIFSGIVYAESQAQL
ncbi:hypothetical protein CpB0377 [Chlamydia pneumoniae TW-183]|uniref:Uncharacterized protein n=2 Tax=Chlamydia pneumoniae TaxID=83558 RepID=Q9Z8H7_CHLPN|nr:hypothetical protein [Chlamydia pneumoniae]AAD18510.1 hypothetical protein CPn_0366 [Chlamydia pneumoniae CWL029]AAF38237.1 hypothetical protein CP_0391 [Chlamydia pneumoniae AR39]AAP98308.1 hypothetical protein CpB0377 [Chlamydia pneumoniae TW-183]CRI32867.1 Uncharacterized protein BN1224_Wien1_A_03740 [Chlamydia pneumoniae]CRI35730.1 Uncharacterized protein BN1224_CM1_A_03770 [Chlamydia pneumoniae]